MSQALEISQASSTLPIPSTCKVIHTNWETYFIIKTYKIGSSNFNHIICTNVLLYCIVNVLADWQFYDYIKNHFPTLC